jgi:tRNA nucleotidyltransferase (CCA-adding enzyme)
MSKTYLVGGSVRDKLLDLPITDKDWVVVGSSVEEMLALDFLQVGKDFPVFLHPKTHEEYALARTERKVAKGYQGFEVNAKNITLEEDLSRRDLTINAMAQDDEGNLIDYFGGVDDLNNGLLRHTSPAFIEDPVRILRIARFGARFKKFGFKVAHSTFKLMQKMVDNGEVDFLVPERVWTEIQKTLSYETPSAFFKILHSCGALEKILPIKYQIHETHKNQFAFLDGLKTQDIAVKWAVFLSKATEDEVKKVFKKISLPKNFKALVLLTVRFQNIAKNFNTQTVENLFKFYKATDSLRRLDRFEQLLEIFTYLDIQVEKIKLLQYELLKIDVKKIDKALIALELPKKQQKVIKGFLEYNQ